MFPLFPNASVESPFSGHHPTFVCLLGHRITVSTLLPCHCWCDSCQHCHKKEFELCLLFGWTLPPPCNWWPTESFPAIPSWSECSAKDAAFNYLDGNSSEAFASVSWHTGLMILRIDACQQFLPGSRAELGQFTPSSQTTLPSFRQHDLHRLKALMSGIDVATCSSCVL